MGRVDARSLPLLLSARAAGIQHPMEAVFMDFATSMPCASNAELARRLGYGRQGRHPSGAGGRDQRRLHAVTGSRRLSAQSPGSFRGSRSQRLCLLQSNGKMVYYAVARVAKGRHLLERRQPKRASASPPTAPGRVGTRSRFIDGVSGWPSSAADRSAACAPRSPIVIRRRLLVVCDVVRSGPGGWPMPASRRLGHRCHRTRHQRPSRRRDVASTRMPTSPRRWLPFKPARPSVEKPFTILRGGTEDSARSRGVRVSLHTGFTHASDAGTWR